MIWKRFQLGSPASKVTEAVTLWKTERGIVEIGRNALAVPIMHGDQPRGYVFHGQGRLLLDAIVETDEGAVGKSVERELDKPFLMLGDREEVQKNFTEATEEDFTKMNYENQQAFLDRAEDLCNRFLKGKTKHTHGHLDEDQYARARIFAFQNRTDKLDVLVSKDSGMIYKATGLVFVSSKNKAVLKSPGEVVCSSGGRSVIIKR